MMGVDIMEPKVPPLEMENVTAIGDGERTAGHVFNAQLTVFGLGTKFSNFLLDVGKAHLVGVAQDWHDQTAG
ncbi:MAG: hypothetical protein RL650_2800 [Pseudomonadota bacterium]